MKTTVKKPSVIIDLDVLTVAHWKGQQKPEADKLLVKVTAKEFYMVTPFILIELLLNWKDKGLVERIEDFYSENTNLWLSDRMVKEQAEGLKVDLEKVIVKLEKVGVKQEDSVLVATAAVFKVDYLITFNRKHLLSKKESINSVLEKAGLSHVKIKKPEELTSQTRVHLSALSLFKNLADIPSFISSANSTGSTSSGITASAFHFLSLIKSSIRLVSPKRAYKPFAQEVLQRLSAS